MKLQNRTVVVHCWEISRSDVTVEVDVLAGKFTLKIGEEKNIP